MTVIVSPALSFHFVKPSHYFCVLFESNLHSKFKGSSNWLIGDCDYICNYIDTYSKLMRLLTLWINTTQLGQLSLWLHYAVMGQESTQKIGYRSFAFVHRQLCRESFRQYYTCNFLRACSLIKFRYILPSIFTWEQWNLFWWGGFEKKKSIQGVWVRK